MNQTKFPWQVNLINTQNELNCIGVIATSCQVIQLGQSPFYVYALKGVCKVLRENSFKVRVDRRAPGCTAWFSFIQSRTISPFFQLVLILRETHFRVPHFCIATGEEIPFDDMNSMPHATDDSEFALVDTDVVLAPGLDGGTGCPSGYFRTFCVDTCRDENLELRMTSA